MYVCFVHYVEHFLHVMHELYLPMYDPPFMYDPPAHASPRVLCSTSRVCQTCNVGPKRSDSR